MQLGPEAIHHRQYLLCNQCSAPTGVRTQWPHGKGMSNVSTADANIVLDMPYFLFLTWVEAGNVDDGREHEGTGSQRGQVLLFACVCAN